MPVGRPKHKVTKENKKTVAKLASVGVPQDDIAKMLGITRKTLALHYSKELNQSRIEALAAVGGALFRQAMDGSTSAAIWFEKSRGGYSENLLREDQAKEESASESIVDIMKALGNE